MTYGEKADWFDSLAADGNDIPVEYYTPPELYHDLIFDYTAFGVLSSSRQSTMSGAGRISLSEVVAYCDLIGLCDYECRVTLLKRIQALDDEFLKIVAEKNGNHKHNS